MTTYSDTASGPLRAVCVFYERGAPVCPTVGRLRLRDTVGNDQERELGRCAREGLEDVGGVRALGIQLQGYLTHKKPPPRRTLQ